MSQVVAINKPAKPAPILVNADKIPEALRSYKQWIVWKWVWNGKKWDKPPFKADGTGNASSTDPNTWTTFNVALAAYQAGDFDGIGFVLTENDPFTMVDLDKCTDELWAVDMMSALDSYTEGTPSGDGYHVISEATKPETMGSKSKDFHSSRVEVYSSGRYMTMTGNHIADYPLTIEKRQIQLETTCKALFRKQEKPKARTSTAQAANLNDHELLERMFSACKGSEGLYRGNQSDDASADDLALCNHLAFMTGGDAARMDAFFRTSGLMRDKWDERHRSDGTTYGQMTIEKAIAGTKNTYNPVANAPAPVDPATIFQSDPKEDEGARPGEFAVPDSCKESFVVQFGAEIARVTEMPESTVIMTTMAALSGILSTTYTTGYPDGTRLPIGFNVVAEQPPGAAKSRALNKVIKPWLKAIKRYNGKQAEKAKAESDETGEEVKPFYIPYPISNATPEAVEQTMTEAGTGHFFLQSAEQGLVKILFGEGQKDRPKNFDLALKGFNGEFHAGVRVTRKKIEREVYGAVVCFAQAGSIKTILNNSDGDGLAERFLHIAEPHRLGQRTHNAGNLNEWMEQEYTALLDQLLMDFDQLQEKGDLDGLRYLGFSSEAMEVIRQFKIKLEPKMQLHADNGENSMTAFLAKADIQARKIAAVMYLSDCLSKCKPFMATIPDHYLNAAIELTEAALGHVEQVLTSLERMGPDAAKAAIYRQFDRKDGRTARELKQNLKKVKPFKDHATPNGYIERIIKGMVNRGELIFDPTDKKLRLG